MGGGAFKKHGTSFSLLNNSISSKVVQQTTRMTGLKPHGGLGSCQNILALAQTPILGSQVSNQDSLLGRSFKSASKGSSTRVSGSEVTEGADGAKRGMHSMLGFQKML